MKISGKNISVISILYMKNFKFIKNFSEISMKDIQSVGGKNASLGEMIQNLTSAGIPVPDGFALTAGAYWEFLDHYKIREKLGDILARLDKKDFSNLKETGKAARKLILDYPIPDEMANEISQAYEAFCRENRTVQSVAIRSSATTEDSPEASFAGQHDSFLNISGTENVIKSTHRCFASLFNDRAIKYREDKGFDHLKTAVSVGIQKMVRSDLSCSGIGFTLDPETGFRDIIHLSGTWGLGENIVSGRVNPDEFYVFKPILLKNKKAIINKKLGTKEFSLLYRGPYDSISGNRTINTETRIEKRLQFVLNDEEITKLAHWAVILENHYGLPIDFEWAKDGISGKIYIVQARPETVHSQKNFFSVKEYSLKQKGTVLLQGQSVGNKIASGIARIITSPLEADKLRQGEILVTQSTNPDWNTVMKRAAAIVTDQGGRTSHAAIVARELGIVAVVGTELATKIIKDGQAITVACQDGKTCLVYDGLLPWEVEDYNFSDRTLPVTKPMLIVSDPDKAFQLSVYPNAGVGLMRMEFTISSKIRIHPMALANFEKLKDENVKAEIEKLSSGFSDKRSFFTTKLSQAIATMAAAFYPKDVIVRMSDFKTNEYRALLGGKEFEPDEENPMIGFRGASRYYDARYRKGFEMECEALRYVRDEMGLTNVKSMIPFCRTTLEGKKVLEVMESCGLKRGENGLEIYVMAEVPSNVILAEEFAQIFDGFSIGSNDLTQLILGVDRDSSTISSLFTEHDPAVISMIEDVIRKAKLAGRKIGLCGQAPSDSPAFTKFLVENHIDSISFNPDGLLRGIANIKDAERSMNSVIKTTA